MASVLGSTPGSDEPLMEAGLDSLGAVELRNSLAKTVGIVAFPGTRGYPTCADATCGWKRTAAPPRPSVALACSSSTRRSTTRDLAAPRTHSSRVAPPPCSTQRAEAGSVHCPMIVSVRSSGRSISSSLQAAAAAPHPCALSSAVVVPVSRVG